MGTKAELPGTNFSRPLQLPLQPTVKDVLKLGRGMFDGFSTVPSFAAFLRDRMCITESNLEKVKKEVAEPCPRKEEEEESKEEESIQCKFLEPVEGQVCFWGQEMKLMLKSRI